MLSDEYHWYHLSWDVSDQWGEKNIGSTEVEIMPPPYVTNTMNGKYMIHNADTNINQQQAKFV